MKTLLRSLSAGLIYPFTFLIFMASVGTEPHYVLPYVMLSALSIIITTKFATKTYSEMNLIWGGALIYLTFFVGVFLKDLGNIWLIAGASIGSSLIFQTILYKYKQKILFPFLFFIIGSVFSISQIGYFINSHTHMLFAEIIIVLLFFVLLWTEPKAFVRFFVYFSNKVKHPVIVKNKEHLLTDKNFIIISNHPTYYDELLIESILPFNVKLSNKIDKYPETIQAWINWVFDYKEVKEKEKILYFPEEEMSFNETFKNWHLDFKKINELCQNKEDIYVLPIIIKNIKNRYELKNDNPLKLKIKQYFKPIEIIISPVIKINSEEDLVSLREKLIKIEKSKAY